MQQFWYSIKKVQGTDSYEFLLANKNCVVNADVFRTILDICPRVEGVNFIDVPDDDTTLAFLIKLGYKGPLYKHTNMFVDHMHQPWRTLAAIINKENVDYPELIWEDLAYQIDHKKEKRSRHENMPFPRFTKVIINYFLKQHNSLSNLKYQHYHTIKDDGIVCRLKFVRVGEDYQEYGLSIPETMLTEAIKQSESYQMFMKYSTGQIPPKKSKGKGSQRKKTADDSHEIVDVYEESEPEPKLVKRKTSSKRRVKKKVTLSVDDNIIYDDPDTALELGKSISKTKAEEAEAARQVHATHARIVKESVLEPTKRRKSGKVTFDPPKKLKGVPSLTPEEQESANIMHALKESKKTSKRQLCMSLQSSLLPQKDYKEGDADDEDDETESDEDDIYKYKIRVRKDKDEEMLNTEVNVSNKGDEEVTDAAKADAKNTSEVKDDPKKTELPPTSSSLSVFLSFGDQFIKHSSDSSLSPSMLRVPVSVISEPLVLTAVQESPSIATVTTLTPPFVSTTPSIPQQTTTLIPTPPITTDALIITTNVFEFDALSVVQLRVAKLKKDVFELKKIDLFVEALAALKTQVSSVVDNYLGSKVADVFQKELKKHTADLIQKYSLQQIPELPKKHTLTVDLEQ
ncbi:hypothetical protein Tco_0817845 [Tanacetum coccineum]